MTSSSSAADLVSGSSGGLASDSSGGLASGSSGGLASGSSGSVASSSAGDLASHSADGSTIKSPQQSKISSLVNADVTKAELIWTMKMISQHFSLNSCRDINDIFKNMFTDSRIAASFQLGPDKASYIISYGLAPYFKNTLMTQLKYPTPVKFSACFDEAFNSIIHKGQFDSHVLFFDDEKKVVSRRYVGSSFMGHACTEDLRKSFLDVHSDLDIPQNLVQISMDGPNVNWALHREIASYMSETNPTSPQLLEIGSCGLHVLHGAYKVGQKATDWQLNSLLKSCHTLFKDSPARRCDYLKANDLDVMHDEKSSAYLFPLKFCGHRWLENGAVITRILQIMDKLVIYVRSVQGKPKLRPTSQSFATIETSVRTDSQQSLCCAKLEFSKFVCEIMEPFLHKFQSERPLAVFLFSELHDVLKTLLSLFIKDEVVASANSAAKMCLIDLNDASNHKPVQKIDIGFGAKQQFKKLSPAEKLDFGVNCKRLLVALCKKIIERAPIKFPLTRAISALSPSVISQSQNLHSSEVDQTVALHYQQYLH